MGDTEKLTPDIIEKVPKISEEIEHVLDYLKSE
jgi:hypothetical protein